MATDAENTHSQGVAEVQAVVLHENGTFSGASDSRKNGRAWGF
jgi:gamma-glutamyltranspeptidase